MSIENLKDRVPGNRLECETDQFPDGLERFAEKVGGCDLTIGLWIAPFRIPDKLNDQAAEQRDRFLCRDGKPIKDMSVSLSALFASPMMLGDERR